MKSNTMETLNIWVLMSSLLGEKYNIYNWHIVVNIFSDFYKIFPHAGTLPVEFIKETNEISLFNEFATSGGSYRSIDNYNYISIKYSFDRFFFIGFSENIGAIDKDIIKFIIETKLENESKDMVIYPSFLPFFIPFNEGDMQNINRSLINKNRIFFLNGLPGTGKKTFICNHISYVYNIDFKKSLISLSNGKNREDYVLSDKEKVIIIKELAFLTEDEQIDIGKQIREDQKAIIFILSSYDPVALSLKDVISKEIEELCIQNRIIFPSLYRRKKYLRENLEILFFLKGRNLPGIVNDKFLEKHSSSGGFVEILTGFQKYFSPPSSILQDFISGKDIRNLVKELEILGIEFGQWVIGNSQNKIAKFLGMSRGSLQHKLKKYDYPYNEWEE